MCGGKVSTHNGYLVKQFGEFYLFLSGSHTKQHEQKESSFIVAGQYGFDPIRVLTSVSIYTRHSYH